MDTAACSNGQHLSKVSLFRPLPASTLPSRRHSLGRKGVSLRRLAIRRRGAPIYVQAGLWRGTAKVKEEEDIETESEPSNGRKKAFKLPAQTKLPGTIKVQNKSRSQAKSNKVVFVAGATGKVGSRTVRELLNLGFSVRASTQNVEKAQALFEDMGSSTTGAAGTNNASPSGLFSPANFFGFLKPKPGKKLEIVECDLEDLESIESALGNAGVIVCCIGASEKEVFDVSGPYRIDFKATENLINAASAAEVGHFVLLTSLGTQKFGFPAAVLNLFWGVLLWKAKAEKALFQSGIPYTIVRPGGMERPTDAYKETHNLVLAEADKLFGGQVSHLQVAELIASIVENPDISVNKIVEAVAETSASLRPIREMLEEIQGSGIAGPEPRSIKKAKPARADVDEEEEKKVSGRDFALKEREERRIQAEKLAEEKRAQAEKEKEAKRIQAEKEKEAKRIQAERDEKEKQRLQELRKKFEEEIEGAREKAEAAKTAAAAALAEKDELEKKTAETRAKAEAAALAARQAKAVEAAALAAAQKGKVLSDKEKQSILESVRLAMLPKESATPSSQPQASPKKTTPFSFLGRAAPVSTEEKSLKKEQAEAKKLADAKQKEEQERLNKEAKELAEKEAAKAKQKEVDEAKRKERELAEAKKKEEEKERLEAEAKRKEEAEAKKKAEEEKAKKEAEDKLKEEEERAKMEAEAKKKEAEEKAKAEAEAKRKEEEERARMEAEAKRKQEELAEAERKEAEEKAKAEAEAKRKEEEEKARMEAEAKRKQEELAEAERKEAEEKAKAEAEAKRKEEEERARMEAEAKRKQEELAEAKKKEEEEQAKKEAEAKKKEEEEKAKALAEAKKKEEEEKAKAEAEAKRKEEEERAKAEAEVKRKQEELAEAKKKEEEEQAKKEAEAKLKEEEERAKAEAEAKKKEEEEKAKAEAKAKKKEEEEKAKAEAEAKRKEEEERVRMEAEAKRRQEELMEAKKIEEEEKARAQAEAKRKEEEEAARMEADAKRKQEEQSEAKKREAEERARAEAEAQRKAEELAEGRLKEEEETEKKVAEAIQKEEEEREKIKAEAKRQEEELADEKVKEEVSKVSEEEEAKVLIEGKETKEASASVVEGEATKTESPPARPWGFRWFWQPAEPDTPATKETKTPGTEESIKMGSIDEPAKAELADQLPPRPESLSPYTQYPELKPPAPPIASSSGNIEKAAPEGDASGFETKIIDQTMVKPEVPSLEKPAVLMEDSAKDLQDDIEARTQKILEITEREKVALEKAVSATFTFNWPWQKSGDTQDESAIPQKEPASPVNEQGPALSATVLQEDASTLPPSSRPLSPYAQYPNLKPPIPPKPFSAAQNGSVAVDSAPAETLPVPPSPWSLFSGFPDIKPPPPPPPPPLAKGKSAPAMEPKREESPEPSDGSGFKWPWQR